VSGYENFLLLISYRIGPWLAIVFVDFFLHPGQPMRPDGLPTSFRRAIEWPGIVAFLVGLAVSIPFMNSPLYTGPMANLLHSADIVGTICGAHVQVLSAAELSIALRVAGVTRAEVREALWTERSLVKTFGPRGSVHLLSA
jgi:purine-cytosine permease-like protein